MSQAEFEDLLERLRRNPEHLRRIKEENQGLLQAAGKTKERADHAVAKMWAAIRRAGENLSRADANLKACSSLGTTLFPCGGPGNIVVSSGRPLKPQITAVRTRIVSGIA